MPVRAVRLSSGGARRSYRCCSGLLSGGSSKIAPPPVQMPRVHSRTSRGPPFGPELPNSGRVPPLPFFPTSAAYSTRHPAGLLLPASGHGVRHVSSLPLLVARRLRAGTRLSRWRHTLRSFPLRGRSWRVAALRSPLAVASGFGIWVRPCCHAWPRVLPSVARPQGLALLRSPLSACRRCHRQVARCFLGLLPHSVLDVAPTASPKISGSAAPVGVRRPRRVGPGIRSLLRLPGGSWLGGRVASRSSLGPEGLRSGASVARAGPEGSAVAVDSLAARRWLRGRRRDLLGPEGPGWSRTGAGRPRASARMARVLPRREAPSPSSCCRYAAMLRGCRRPEGRWRPACPLVLTPEEPPAAVFRSRRS